MDKKERFNSSAELYNATTYFFNYLVGVRKTIDKKIIKKTELALLSTYLLSLKEEVIIKKENLSYESNLYQNSFEILFEKIFKKIPQIIIDGKVADEATVFSIIRNKFAHGDFIYLEESDEVIFSSYGTTFKLHTNDLLEFYFEIQKVIMDLQNDNIFTREILYNKSKKILTKKLESEKEVEDFLKLFILRRYCLRKMDNDVIPYILKQTFNFAIEQINNVMNKGEDSKNLEEDIRKIYEKQGYAVAIENKKIKDKEKIFKIKQAILNNERLKQSEQSMEYLTYSYGEIVHNILIGENKEGLISGAITDLLILEDTNIKKELFLFKQKIENCYNELIGGLLVTRFNTLYCQQLDDIYKIDNNYHFDRSEMLDFSLLNLDEFHPEIINVDKKGISNIENEINSLTNKIKKLDNSIIKSTNTKDALEKLKPLDHKKQIVYDRCCEVLKTGTLTRKKLCEILYEKYLELEKVKQDYKDNEKYFYNLAIIEGIRNSIAHGNVEILNALEVENFNDVKIRFTNVYKGEIVFQLTLTLYNFESLFEDYNISVLDNFGKDKKLFKNI